LNHHVNQPSALLEARGQIVSLITAHSRPDRYASLLSRSRTSAARQLILQVCSDITAWEQQSRKRIYERRSRSGEIFSNAVERFVGDLLRAKADKNASGRVYRSIGKTSFDDDPVNFDAFNGVLDGLKALSFVGHEKGQTRYRRIEEWDLSVPLRGRASRFWATPKLIGLAEHYGIHQGNVANHFKPDPPSNPLVMRDYATGKGVNRQRGSIMKNFPRTEEAKRFEADVRELNEFLGDCRFAGGEHHGYTRNFNNAAWNKGGRLYSVGGGYQQLPEEKRLHITINGEAVAEIDIKASYLTIYHARLGVPLENHVDPYERAGVERSIAKSWMIHSFGKSRPQMQWPAEAVEDYKKDTGKNLREVANAKDVASKMLAAFPALQKLENYNDIWADLQFKEAEAVIGTMLILMRTHGTPSLSMHDGIIVPRSKAELAKAVLAEQYREVVGVEPMLTVEPQEHSVSAVDL
jgi:hypothetical protein